MPVGPHRRASEALAFGLVLVGDVGPDARPRRQLAGRGAARLHHLLLCRHLHDVAEALDAAEHRDRRRGRRAAARSSATPRRRATSASPASCCSPSSSSGRRRISGRWRWSSASDYGRAGVPMMPNVPGADRTRLEILVYSLVLAPIGVAALAAGLRLAGLWRRRDLLGGALPRLARRRGLSEARGRRRAPRGRCGSSSFRSPISSCCFSFLSGSASPISPATSERVGE